MTHRTIIEQQQQQQQISHNKTYKKLNETRKTIFNYNLIDEMIWQSESKRQSKVAASAAVVISASTLRQNNGNPNEENPTTTKTKCSRQ